jgi:hypothetical protein
VTFSLNGTMCYEDVWKLSCGKYLGVEKRSEKLCRPYTSAYMKSNAMGNNCISAVMSRLKFGKYSCTIDSNGKSKSSTKMCNMAILTP